MRQMIGFDCLGDRLVGTLDEADGTTGLLIVSGGNEIRSGAYAGQAAMAQHFAAGGHPVFRYDRRGVGDSEGLNKGFESSADDIAAAVAAFRNTAPRLNRLVAFGNCDAATALTLFHSSLAIDRLVLANPWVIENGAGGDVSVPHSAAAIRARYWARLKNPGSLLDLLTGKIDLKKLAGGLVKATQNEAPSELAQRLSDSLEASAITAKILIAERDTTALAFMGAWKGNIFGRVSVKVDLNTFDTASHSFADAAAKEWLYRQVGQALSAV